MDFSIQLVPISELEKGIPTTAADSLPESWPLLEWLNVTVLIHLQEQEHFVVLFRKNKIHLLQSEQSALHFKHDLPILTTGSH